MPLQPPTPYDFRAGTPIPTATDYNAGIRDAFSFLTAKVAFRGRGTSTQSVAASTWTAINFQTADEDNYGGWSSGSPSLYTAQVAGVYAVDGGVFMAGQAGTNTSAATGVGVDPVSSSVLVSYVNEGLVPSDSNPWCVPAGLVTYLGVGDSVSIYLWQNSGTLNTSTATGSQSWMDVYWLSS